MDRSWTVAAAGVSILLAGGCGERDVVCLAEPVYGIVLRVGDSASGEPAAAGAYAVARDRNNLVILSRLESDPLQFRGVGIPGVYAARLGSNRPGGDDGRVVGRERDTVCKLAPPAESTGPGVRSCRADLL